MGCQQGKVQTMQTNNTTSKGGFNRANTMKNGNNNQNLAENELEINQSLNNEDTKNENGITNDENRQNPKSNSQSEHEEKQKNKKNGGVSPQKTKDGQDQKTENNDNPPLKYTFTINGKSMKQIEDEKQDDNEDNFSDVLLSTEIREGNTPQLSEEDEYLQNDRIYDKKDISLADLGDGMMFEGIGERKMTLHKAATLKKSGTLKKKLEQKQIIHALDIQPSRDYFAPDYFKQFTRKNSHKENYNKANTLFVPQPF